MCVICVSCESLFKLREIARELYIEPQGQSPRPAAEERPLGNIMDLDPEDMECEEESVEGGL